MNVEEEKRVRKIINQGLKKKFSISETDLLAPNGQSWDVIKSSFKETISNLISNLENDEYDDASGDIDKTISMLNKWKQKIKKDINDSSIKENIDLDASMSTAALIHHLGEDGYYFKNIIPSSEQFINDEDGGYIIKCKFAIPKNEYQNFDDAYAEAEKILEKQTGSSIPGQSFTKSYVEKSGETPKHYIIGYKLKYGYDI